MGETRVDLLRLLEDLRDAYPGSLEETILTEIVANALDSGARRLAFETDRATSTHLARDDGSGMTRRELARYHDLASSTKRRGRGIGFAGVGIKLGLLACDEVITETRRGAQHTATTWRLANRTRAPWSWTEPPYLLTGNGTAVLLRLANPMSRLLEPGFVEETVLRHFQPLFEPEFIDPLTALTAGGGRRGGGSWAASPSRPSPPPPSPHQPHLVRLADARTPRYHRQMNAPRPAARPRPDDVLTRATLAAAGRLGIRNARLGEVIGTSEASVSRLSSGRRIDPSSKEGELALLFLRMFRSLDALVGGDDARARAWLHAENVHLGGVPAERIRRVEGLVDVIQYLDGMRGRL